MSQQPLSSAQQYANPQLHISPTLYTLNDVGTFAERNRKVDQTLSFLKFVPIHDGKLRLYHRGPSDAFPGPDADMVNQDADAEVTQSAPYVVETSPAATFHIQEIAGRFGLRSQTREVLSDDIEQQQFQVSAKVRAIRATFGHYFIFGNSATAGQFDGLNVWTTAGSGLGQLLVHPAGVFPFAEIFDTLDRAIIAVQTNDRDLSKLVIVCHSKLLTALTKRARQLNNETLLTTEYCRQLGYDCPHYMGIPICINDHILAHEDKGATDFYVFDCDSVGGLVNSNAPDTWPAPQKLIQVV